MKERQPEETGGADPEAGERLREENAEPRKKSGNPGLRKRLLPWLIAAVAAVLIGAPIWLYSIEKKKAQEQTPGEDVSEFPADGIPQEGKEDIEPPAPEPLGQKEEGEPLEQEEEGEPLEQEEEGEPVTPETHFTLGLDAYDKGDREEAARHWGIAALSGKDPNAYFNWGLVLYELARAKGDEALFLESFDKYAEAVRLKPDYHEAYYNWGYALMYLARTKEDEALFREAFTKYAEAVSIKPNYDYYRNWAVALHACAKIVKDEAEREALFKQADEKMEEAGELRAAGK
jgi:tetratricopeptide (TPR) repeat protein